MMEHPVCDMVHIFRVAVAEPFDMRNVWFLRVK